MDIDKQMKEDEKNFGTQNQRDIIYNEYLVPLKVRISEIASYDIETAKVLLQKYISIEKEENRDITDILADITELDLNIQEYEENEGKAKKFKAKSTIILNQLNSLKEKCEEFNVGDFENEFLDIKDKYAKNSRNYAYIDKSNIDAKISEVQAKLIIKKARLGSLDLYNEISKEDAEKLNILINNSLLTLSQSENPDIQKIVNEIKYKIMDRTDAAYDPEIWRLLDTAQRGVENTEQIGIEQDTPKVATSNALVPITSKKRKGFTLPSLGEIFGINVIKIGDQKMKTSTKINYKGRKAKVRELGEVDLSGLLPAKSSSAKQLISDYVKNKSEINEFYFYNEQGEQEHIKKMMQQTENYHYTYVNIIQPDGSKLIGNINVAGIMRRTSPVINYTGLLDKVLNSNIKEQLLREIGIFMEKFTLSKGNTKDIGELLEELPIYSNLSKSFEKFEQTFKKMGYGLDNKKSTDEKPISENESFKESIKLKTNQQKDISNLVSEREDAFFKLLETYNEDKNKSNQSNTEQEVTNEENGDGTEYRGG